MSLKDTTFTKIFVGGLPYHTTDDTLRKFFERFGDIDEAVVITDRATGKSRGYGFVTMSTKEAAQEAIRDPNPNIDGRKANVNLAYLGAKPRTVLGNSSSSAAANAVLHLGAAAYPSLQSYGLQPLIYPSHTLLGPNLAPNMLSYNGNGTSLSPSTAHYSNAYDFANQYTNMMQFDAANVTGAGGGMANVFPYSGSQNASNQANLANYAYAALAQQTIAAGAPSLSSTYQP